MKYIEINGETFEVIKPRKYTVTPVSRSRYEDNLYKAYEKPSKAKISIFEDWKKWAKECGAHISDFSIYSRNARIFTLRANYLDDNGEFIGVIYITPCHNRLYLA